MLDFNETNHRSTLQVGHTISKAWSMVKGFKGSAWGGFAFLFLIAIGIAIAIGIVMLIAGLSMGVSMGADPSTLPTHSAFFLKGLNVLLSLLSDFFIIPIAVGLSLLAVHRLKSESFTAYRVFDYFKWRYMWRFFTLLIIGYLLFLVAALLFALIIIPMVAIYSGEPTITTGLIITASVFGIIAFFAILYIGSALNFANMLIAEKGMPLAHALGCGFKGVTKNFFRILGVLILSLLIGMAVYLCAFVIAFAIHLAGFTGLGAFIGICIVITALIWLLPWILNIWALMYRDIFGLEENSEHIENITNQTTDQ